MAGTALTTDLYRETKSDSKRDYKLTIKTPHNNAQTQRHVSITHVNGTGCLATTPPFPTWDGPSHPHHVEGTVMELSPATGVWEPSLTLLCAGRTPHIQMGMTFTLESSVEGTTHLYRDISNFKRFQNHSSIWFKKYPSQPWTLASEWVLWLYFKRFYMWDQKRYLHSFPKKCLSFQRTVLSSGFLPSNLSPQSHEFRWITDKYQMGA